MVRKTVSNGTAAAKNATKSATARKSARKSANGASVSVAAKKSTEITPRRAVIARTAKTLKSPKVLVPLAVAVGVGIAAVRKAVMASNGKSKVLPRIAKEVSPRFNEAVHALAELGRELRAKIR
ncbi:MAG TPA: hypothetical protein VLF18_21490 [Tahibacter sp.]|uniref:hypothetical protein n=1 Tax=Tahibacter sp. TaxID=2056211 RepID=UPI002C1B5E48|nr:hypothetical protein [Tahibacter sp.]HSX62765.1 hypothetical protein [Tahibacter sp.]